MSRKGPVDGNGDVRLRGGFELRCCLALSYLYVLCLNLCIRGLLHYCVRDKIELIRAEIHQALLSHFSILP